MYAVILAGGSGTRLWPASRNKSPKQFHKLTSEKSLFEETFNRIKSLVPETKCYVITTKSYADELNRLMPKLKKNILVEPIGKNTAPAIGLAASIIVEKDEDAVMVTLPSDHFIKNEKEFCEVLLTAKNFLDRNADYIVTLGINPTIPDTGLGYILLGKEFSEAERRAGENKIFHVDSFIEKPDIERAKKFVMTWGYLWNSGIFVFKAKHLLGLFRKYLPETHNRLIKIQKAIGKKDFHKILEEEYKEIDPISIDYGILEKYNKMVVIPADIGWSDIGNWASLKDVLSQGEENVVRGDHVGIETKSSLIYSKKLIATIGLENFIIVETEDSILICPKDKAQKVKELIEKLKQDGKGDHL